jgi:O-antigen/teichoic acid export membrane protein
VSLVRKSTLSAITAVVMAGGRFATVAILARRLSTVAFGQFVYAQWMVDIAFMVTALGVNAVAARYLAEYSGNNARRHALLRGWLPWAIGLPILAGIATVGCAAISGITFRAVDAALLALWATSSGWWAMQTSSLIGSQRFEKVLSSNILATVIVIVGVVLLPLNDAPEFYLFALMATSNLAACAVGVKVRQNVFLEKSSLFPSELAVPWESIRRYALNMWLTGLLWGLVWSRGELPVVRFYLSDSGVAEYTAALTLFFGAMQAVMIWVGGIAPHLTELWGNGKKAEALAIARRLSDIQLLIAGGASVLLWCVGPELLKVAFGSTYAERSVLPLSLLAVGLITLSTSVQNHLLQIITDARFNRNSALVGLVVLYAASVIIVGALGTVGAALSRAAVMFTLMMISLVISKRSFGMNVMSSRNTAIAFFAIATPVGVGIVVHLTLLERVIATALSLFASTTLLRNEDGTMVSTYLFYSIKSRLFR